MEVTDLDFEHPRPVAEKIPHTPRARMHAAYNALLWEVANSQGKDAEDVIRSVAEFIHEWNVTPTMECGYDDGFWPWEARAKVEYWERQSKQDRAIKEGLARLHSRG